MKDLNQYTIIEKSEDKIVDMFKNDTGDAIFTTYKV